MIFTSSSNTQIVTDVKLEGKCAKEVLSFSNRESTHATTFAESKKFKDLATDALAAFFPSDKDLLSVPETGNNIDIIHSSRQSVEAAVSPAAEVNAGAAGRGSAEGDSVVAGHAVDGGGCSGEKAFRVAAETATSSGAYRTPSGSVCVTEEQLHRRAASVSFRSVELEERFCQQPHRRRRSWRSHCPTGHRAGASEVLASWRPTALAEIGKRKPHLEKAVCSSSNVLETSRSRHFTEDDIILADNEYESESEVFEEDECQSSVNPKRYTRKQSSKPPHCEAEDKRYVLLQSSASSDSRHRSCKTTPSAAIDVSFPPAQENYLNSTFFPVTQKAAQKSLILPQQIGFTQDNTTHEQATCKSITIEKQEFTRVLVVARRWLRKSRYVDYVGELHFNLLQQFNALPVVVPRTGATLQQLEGYMPMHGLLLVEGEDLGEKMQPYRTHNVDLDVPQSENIQKMVVQALYPEEVVADDDRNEIEKALLERCEKDNIPVLGICRGCQMLNVFRGGSLFFDIGLQLGGQVQHLDYNNSDCHRHDLWVVSDSPLGDWFTEERAKALADDALLLPEQVLLLQDPPSQLAAVAAAMMPLSTMQGDHTSSSGSRRQNSNGDGLACADSSTAAAATGLPQEAAAAASAYVFQKKEKSSMWLLNEAQAHQEQPQQQQAVILVEKERQPYAGEDSSNEALKGSCGFTPSASRIETTVGSGYASASSVAASPAASLFSPCPTPRFSVSRTAASSAAIGSEEAAATVAASQLTAAAVETRSETEATMGASLLPPAAEEEALLAQALSRAQQQLLLLKFLKKGAVSSNQSNSGGCSTSGICSASGNGSIIDHAVSKDTSSCNSAGDAFFCDTENKELCTRSSGISSSSTLQQHTYVVGHSGETSSSRESSCYSEKHTTAARTVQPRCSQPLQQKLLVQQQHQEGTAWLKLPKTEGVNDAVWQRRQVEEGGKLFSISVNSYHHQGVRELGRGLVPMGFTQQGVIEAFCDKKMLQQEPLLLLSDAQQALSQEREIAADVAETAEAHTAEGTTTAQAAYAHNSTISEGLNVAQAAAARASSMGASTAATSFPGREGVRCRPEEAAVTPLFYSEDSSLYQHKKKKHPETNRSSQHSSTFYVGIQFHPERMLEDYRGCQRVMEAFVTACHAFRKRQHQATADSPDTVAPLCGSQPAVKNQGAAAAVHAAAAFVAAACSNAPSVASVHAEAPVTAAEKRYEEGRGTFVKESFTVFT